MTLADLETIATGNKQINLPAAGAGGALFEQLASEGAGDLFFQPLTDLALQIGTMEALDPEQLAREIGATPMIVSCSWANIVRFSFFDAKRTGA